MKRLFSLCCAALVLASFNGCFLWHKHSRAAKPSATTASQPAAATEPVMIGEAATAAESAPAPQPPAAPQPAATPKPKARAETLTGKVVLVEAGYRVRLADDQSGTLFRLTRAKRSREFVAEQINLRKYYEKTIVIHGKREDDWIWSAEIVGQWNKPGESRGPNLLAPRVPNR